eukprot:CAMPEP_0167782268 /NCGR_PEP_ID=MMETSP0111_2-20121227/6420_1 /TAXON_ID=91324 /ORGANISM="Lotharella globosa, Strain CCCM811" /LENGTH=144 /DNA_ID=CAMNT_0007673075 /DNA_START=40 /DNA_END=474 /DNA_ORIENTATION=+
MPYNTVIGEPPEFDGTDAPRKMVTAPSVIAPKVEKKTLPGLDKWGRTIVDPDLRSEFSDWKGWAIYTPTGKYPKDHYLSKMEEFHEHNRQRLLWEGRVRYLRKHMNKCQREEGVNHYKNCKTVVDKYIKEITSEPRFFSFSLYK